MARAHKAAVMGPKGSGIVKRVALGLVHYLQRSYVKYSWSQDPRIGWFLRRNLFSPHNSLHSGSVILTSGEREREKKKKGVSNQTSGSKLRHTQDRAPKVHRF